MSAEEADGWQIKAPDAFLRLDGAKANHDRKNPTRWYEKAVYKLDSGAFGVALQPWDPPADAALTSDKIDELLLEVSNGYLNEPYSKQIGAYPRSISQAMRKLGIITDAGQRSALAELIQRGVQEAAYRRPNGNKANGLRHPNGAPAVNWV
jgi:hypothetical protein